MTKETKIQPHLWNPGGVKCTECGQTVAYAASRSEVAVCLKCRKAAELEKKEREDSVK